MVHKKVDLSVVLGKGQLVRLAIDEAGYVVHLEANGVHSDRWVGVLENTISGDFVVGQAGACG